jgi:hypothetical protein
MIGCTRNSRNDERKIVRNSRNDERKIVAAYGRVAASGRRAT